MGHYDEYYCLHHNDPSSLSNVLFSEINRVSRIILILTACTCMLILTRG